MPTQIPSPIELELQAALAQQAEMLAKFWTITPPQLAVNEARLWNTKLNMSAHRVRTAYIAVHFTPEYKP